MKQKITTRRSEDNLSPSRKAIKVMKEIARTSIKIHKPPPILVCGINDFKNLMDNLKLEEAEGYEKQKKIWEMTPGSRFIAGSDYNAKHTFWGSRLITIKGRDLFKSANKIKAQFISTRKPTYWSTDPNKLHDLIDFYLMKGIT
ncbi:Endonuclease/exonuclease/phosphatase [Cinara cedri]|uniref:Endonuclease/exonuclease/phosphatase n=1 Tax=Cinara cedri TaxID=506608 RepID=A0A5E4N9T5_9HEMI|nr:Endonuclease/exonuclease/phosphatase [Cinara cedri]